MSFYLAFLFAIVSVSIVIWLIDKSYSKGYVDGWNEYREWSEIRSEFIDPEF